MSRVVLILVILITILAGAILFVFLPESAYKGFLNSVKLNSSASIQQAKECKLEKGEWVSGLAEIQSANEGERIALSVRGAKCQSISIRMKVFDSEGNLVQDLGERKFVRDKAVAFWFATPGEFYFEASHDFDSVTSGKIEIIPKSQETITTAKENAPSAAGGSGGASSGGASGSSSASKTASCSPPKYTSDLKNPKVCDYRLIQQNKYSELDLTELGMTKRGWSLNGGHLLAHGYPLETVLSFSKEDVAKNFDKYLNNHPELKKDTSDFINIDIEEELMANRIEQNYGNDTELQKKVMAAIKMRIEVVREALPNAKLVLWNTPNVHSKGNKNNPGQIQQMIGHKKMAQAGVYDELDYFITNLYIRYGPDDGPLFYTYEDMTRLGVESALEMTNGKGEHLPVIAAMGGHIANLNSNNAFQKVPEEVSRKQIEIINEYEGVEIVAYWFGHDNYSGINVLEFLQDVSPAPAECFCPKQGTGKSGN